jgi:uncharacterized protein YjiS (DUF1127 family)
MAYMTSSTSAAAPASGGIASRLTGFVVAVQDHFQVRRSINELRALSPEALRDIGIERSEIERVARFGRIGY